MFWRCLIFQTEKYITSNNKIVLIERRSSSSAKKKENERMENIIITATAISLFKRKKIPTNAELNRSINVRIEQSDKAKYELKIHTKWHETRELTTMKLHMKIYFRKLTHITMMGTTALVFIIEKISLSTTKSDETFLSYISTNAGEKEWDRGKVSRERWSKKYINKAKNSLDNCKLNAKQSIVSNNLNDCVNCLIANYQLIYLLLLLLSIRSNCWGRVNPNNF